MPDQFFKPIDCRPWTLLGLSPKLIESHYENNYGGALRRLNAIARELEALDFGKSPGYVVNGLKREEQPSRSIPPCSTSSTSRAWAATASRPSRWPKRSRATSARWTAGAASSWRWAMPSPEVPDGWCSSTCRAIAGSSTSTPRSEAVAGGMPILALDMYEHAYHIDFGANAKAYVDAFMRNIDWKAVEGRYEDGCKVAPPRPLVQEEFGDGQGVSVEEVKEMLDSGRPVQFIDARPRHSVSRTQEHHRRRHLARPGARAGMDGRALQIGARGGVLRLRLPRRLPHGDRAARSRLRRDLHEGRPFRVAGDRRPDLLGPESWGGTFRNMTSSATDQVMPGSKARRSDPIRRGECRIRP